MSNLNAALVLDSVLASLVSSYDVTEVPVVKARKVSKPKSDKVRVVRAPSNNGTVKKVMSSPIATLPVGSLDAAGFMAALATAGKIRRENGNGVMMTVTDPNKQKADEVQAIAGFVGYDFSGAHGSQLDAARLKAGFVLRPVKSETKVTATVKGFVAGMPNGTAKVASDLVARIKMATDLMLDEEKKAREFDSDSAEYVTHMTLAAVESERIQHMRADLANIIGE